jgi:hypothetical protein
MAGAGRARRGLLFPQLEEATTGFADSSRTCDGRCFADQLAQNPSQPLQDYSWEELLAEKVAAKVGPQNRLFAVQRSMLLYCVSKRYPPLPFIHTERQTTYWLERHPDAIIGALRDRA